MATRLPRTRRHSYRGRGATCCQRIKRLRHLASQPDVSTTQMQDCTSWRPNDMQRRQQSQPLHLFDSSTSWRCTDCWNPSRTSHEGDGKGYRHQPTVVGEWRSCEGCSKVKAHRFAGPNTTERRTAEELVRVYVDYSGYRASETATTLWPSWTTTVRARR